MKYYHITSSARESLIPADSWYLAPSNGWLCMSCRYPMRHITVLDAIVHTTSRRPAIDFIAGVGLGVLSTRLLEVLGEVQMNDNLFLGHVKFESGSICAQLLTFLGKDTVYIRGDMRSEVRKCERCERVRYRAAGDKYLCDTLLTGRMAYQSNDGQLIVNELLCDRLRSKVWSSMNICEIPVVELPMDGLPVDATPTISRVGGGLSLENHSES